VLTDAQADEVAQLLNERNELTGSPYTRPKVLKASTEYRIRLSSAGAVVACVQVKQVQWYQVEVLHLTVAKGAESKGFGKSLIREAECVARAKDARLIQCTIRADNERSCGLFEKCGFRRVNHFFNVKSGNNVGIFQKILEPARASGQSFP
jgi:ribosomal protein S18 acetylase RimI-like enzyme